MFSEQYKKMILALPPKFFDGWVWQAGDRAMSLDDPYKREVLIISTHIQIYQARSAEFLYPYSIAGDKSSEHIMRLIPLPTQSQLQTMANSDWKNAYEKFISWYYEKGMPFGAGYTSPEEMWLSYCVALKFRLRWNGEKWV